MIYYFVKYFIWLYSAIFIAFCQIGASQVQEIIATLGNISSVMRYKHLTIKEREKMQRLLWEGNSIKFVSKGIGTKIPINLYTYLSSWINRRFYPKAIQ